MLVLSDLAAQVDQETFLRYAEMFREVEGAQRACAAFADAMQRLSSTPQEPGSSRQDSPEVPEDEVTENPEGAEEDGPRDERGA
jgi:hypothetical protein